MGFGSNCGVAGWIRRQGHIQRMDEDRLLKKAFRCEVRITSEKILLVRKETECRGIAYRAGVMQHELELFMD